MCVCVCVCVCVFYCDLRCSYYRIHYNFFFGGGGGTFTDLAFYQFSYFFVFVDGHVLPLHKSTI